MNTMMDMFKMDLRRLFKGKLLYIMLVVLTAVVASSIFASPSEGFTLAKALGISETGAIDFMGSGMATSVIFGMLGLIISFIVCNDFSSGFAKNVFSVHANKRDYLFSKIGAMLVASAIMIVVYILEVIIFMGFGGRAFGDFSAIGLIMFLVQKWLLSAAFCAVMILINLLFRNKGIGIVAVFLLATGGLVMGASLLFNMIGANFLQVILNFTIYGSALLSKLHFSFLTFVQVLLTAAVWTGIYGYLGALVLNKKDIA